MSLLLSATAAERQRTFTGEGRAAFRLRLVKLACMAILGVCFWYSVPYAPLKIQVDQATAAAAEADAYAGSGSRQLAMPIIALVSLFMLWRLPKRGHFGGRLTWIAAAYCLWVGVSVLWAADQAITTKRVVVFFIDALFAVTLATRFSVFELAALGFTATSVVAIISLFVDIVTRKTFAPFDPDYRFAAVMSANFQALNLVASIVCALTLAQKRPRWLLWLAPWCAIALGLLYITRSRLGTIVCSILLIILILRLARSLIKPATRAFIVIGLLAIIAPALIIIIGSQKGGAGAAQMAFMMGRTDTENTSNLSNRAPLWSELMESVETRPWLGFGYASFWTPARVERVSLDQGWTVPNAHDTYLDQTLSGGIIGATLYTLMLLGGLIIAWRRNAREQTPESLLPALLLTWIALTSLAESTPLDPILPTLLAYTCLVKMTLVEGSERASDRNTDTTHIISGGPLPTTYAEARS